jgi:Flp pilus assembly protein TadD
MAESPGQLSTSAGFPSSGPAAGNDREIRFALARARALEDTRSFDEAAAILLPLLASQAASADAAYRLASIRMKQGDLLSAEDLLRQSLATRFEDANAHTNFGVVCDMQGRSEEAIRAFRRAIALAPHESAAYLNLGALYGELGRLDDAERELRAALRLRPSFDAHFNLALVYYRRGDLAAAESHFAAALDFERAQALCHFYRGQCLLRRGLSAEAVSAFRAALAEDAGMARARLALGQALNKLGQYRQAIRELDPLARTQPQDRRVHYQLGIAYDGLNMKAEAHESYRQAQSQAH